MYCSRMILTIGLAITLVSGGRSVGAADQVALELKWSAQFQFAGYYAAKEKGFYAAEGLDVTIRPRDPKTSPVDQVLTGAAEFGISDASLILRRLHGREVVVVAAVFQHSPLVLLTRSKDKILGPLELKNKRVMRQKGIDDAAITAMFDHEGMRDADIIDIEHDFDDMALLNNNIDAMTAYLTNQPYLYQQNKIPIHIINPMNYGIDFYGDMLFTSESLMRIRPDLVLRFRRASMQGWAYAMHNQDEVIGWLINRYDSKKTREHLKFEAREMEKMILPELVEIGHLNSERFNRIAEIYRTQNMALPESLLDGIDYRDYLEAESAVSKWVYWLLVSAGSLLALSVVLIALNRHLRKLSERSAHELKLAHDNQKRYIDIIDKHVITSSTDLEGNIISVSDAFCRISKYSKSELIGKNHNAVRHPDMPREFYAEMWATIQAGKSWQGEIKNRCKDGVSYWVEIFIEPDFTADGEISGYTAIRYDISDKKRIEDLSTTDRLTGMNNRRKLDQVFALELSRARRFIQPLSVILFDIDHFKHVNDNFGHQRGDEVLIELAKLIHENIRDIDIAGRWGGEEFMVICPATALPGATILAEKLRTRIEAHRFDEVGGKTASFGVVSTLSGESEELLLKRVDAALYRAKKGGRNCVELAE